MSAEKVSSSKTSKHDQSPGLVYDNARMKLRFKRSILNQNKVTYDHEPIVNICIICRLTPGNKSSDIVFENCLFGKLFN